MTKGELVRFLQPFDDDIRVVVRGDAPVSPVKYDLQYHPSTDDRAAIVVIHQSSGGSVETGQGA